jgi:hypothetical protein
MAMDQSEFQKLITDLEYLKERLSWLEKDHLQIKKDLEKIKPTEDSKTKLPATHTDFWVGD